MAGEGYSAGGVEVSYAEIGVGVLASTSDKDQKRVAADIVTKKIRAPVS